MADLAKYQEFSDQLREHYSVIYGFILSLVHNPDDADDVFQQTALTLWQKYDDFRLDGSFRAWACGVARFSVLTFMRAKRRDRVQFNEEAVELLTQWQAEADEGQQTARQEALRFCMEKLNAAQRDMLRRYYEQRENARQIAESVGRTAHSVHSSLKHIRTKLYECIQWRLGEKEDGQ